MIESPRIQQGLSQNGQEPGQCPRRKRIVRFTVAAVLVCLTACVGVPGLWLWRELVPPDRVAVSINNVSADVRFICLIAETNQGPEAMNWYVGVITPSAAMHPRDCSVSIRVANEGGTLNANFQWKESTRFVVLTRNDQDEWKVSWFTPDEVNLTGRRWLFGGGTSRIVMPNPAAAEAVSDEFLEHVDLD
jgi:hypothetical protein